MNISFRQGPFSLSQPLSQVRFSGNSPKMEQAKEACHKALGEYLGLDPKASSADVATALADFITDQAAQYAWIERPSDMIDVSFTYNAAPQTLDAIQSVLHKTLSAPQFKSVRKTLLESGKTLMDQTLNALNTILGLGEKGLFEPQYWTAASSRAGFDILAALDRFQEGNWDTLSNAINVMVENMTDNSDAEFVRRFGWTPQLLKQLSQVQAEMLGIEE